MLVPSPHTTFRLANNNDNDSLYAYEKFFPDDPLPKPSTISDMAPEL
jgi:hypothetical protein